jgi:sterol desaturase/sphingolipid hydroxylase (fatty acid hydroxylase superfamily)
MVTGNESAMLPIPWQQFESWQRLEARSYWILLVVSFLAVALWESRRPKLALTVAPERRWSRHGILMLLYSGIWMAIYRAGPVVVALRFAGSRFGLLNKLALPYSARFVLAILALDFVRYAAHWTEHHVPLLWRLHMVHHSDPDFDVSTGFRAHPLEVVYTQGALLAAVAILAPPVAAVLTVELLTCVESSFGHANVILPGWLERSLRAVIVTPDMHRIHHSADAREQCRNLGDVFPWWDRLLGTYLAHAASGDRILVGLEGVDKARSVDLSFMLAEPFLAQPEGPVEQSTAALS